MEILTTLQQMPPSYYALALGLMALLALFSLPIGAGLAALYGGLAQAVLARRFARHLLHFAGYLQVILLIVSVAFVYLYWSPYTLVWPGLLHSPFVYVQGGGLAFSLLCALLAFFLAKKKTSSIALCSLSFLWFLGLAVFWLLFFFGVYHEQVAQSVALTKEAVESVLPPLQEILTFQDLWAELLAFVLLSAKELFTLFYLIRALLLAMLSGFVLSLLWLIVRRNLDDFGRDYYAFAARFAARGALFFALLLCAFLGHVMFWYPEIAASFTYAFYASFGALGLCAIFLFIVQFASQPMRHKLSMFLAFLCSYATCLTLFL